jgi:hypothetical protein
MVTLLERPASHRDSRRDGRIEDGGWKFESGRAHLPNDGQQHGVGERPA